MKFFLPFLTLILISGCGFTTQPNEKTNSETLTIKNIEVLVPVDAQTPQYIFNNLNNTIIDIADQLFHTNYNKKTPLRIILTSFTDLNNLDKTSSFGRLVSESMFNELHIRNFKISDFRGQDAVSVNDEGEFHITRDVSKLKDSIESTEFILVGTYVKFEHQSLLINARIIDSITGEVVSSARAIYQPKDCTIFGICEVMKTEEEIMNNKYNIYDTGSKTVIEDDTKSQFSIVPDEEIK